MKLQNEFSDALLKEITLRRNYLSGEKIDTIYFGGGTPSLLPQKDLSRVMQSIYSAYEVAADAEITLEANPDDFSPENLSGWKTNGINRLSIGIQSFFEEDLLWMNRAHNAAQAETCILMAQDAGISNISIDLIYGTPTLSDERWRHNLQYAAELNIPHLSCYALTVETGTALEIMTKKKKIAPVSSDDQARQFLIMTELLTDKGYEHYEISNLALPGKRSKHNSSYWSGAKYLGLGPSAHSFNGSSRQWNISNNALYIQSIAQNQVPSETEQLSVSQQYNEYVMTSLRTLEGTDINHVQRKFGKEYSDVLFGNAQEFIQKAWLSSEKKKLILTREGKLFADRIASELFVV